MVRGRSSGNKTEPFAAFRPLSVIRLKRLILLTRARHAASLHRCISCIRWRMSATQSAREPEVKDARISAGRAFFLNASFVAALLVLSQLPLLEARPVVRDSIVAEPSKYGSPNPWWIARRFYRQEYRQEIA